MKAILGLINKDLMQSLLAVISGLVMGAVSLNYYNKNKSNYVLIMPALTALTGAIIFPSIAGLHAVSIVTANGLLPLARQCFFERSTTIKF